MDNIAKQARQGSVAAIIQILNDKLADSGVRTRAMLADGMLQLLCEASTTQQLEQSNLVQRIREILEALAPRSIRHVNINSRIVREQQLLWLEEINRDPENQLLWSEQITLAKPNPFKQVANGLSARQSQRSKPPLPKKLPVSMPKRPTNKFRRGIVWGLGVSSLILLVGWLFSPKWFSSQQRDAIQSETPVESAPQKADPFAEAVTLAEQASLAGKTAQSPADWLDLAAKWQKASDLMAQVPAEDPRYQTARERVELYSQYSQMTQQQAQNSRNP